MGEHGIVAKKMILKNKHVILSYKNFSAEAWATI